MDLRKKIISSPSLIEVIESGLERIRLKRICKILNISIKQLVEVLEHENIIVQSNPNATVSSDLLKQILLREPEIVSEPEQIEQSVQQLLTQIDELDKSTEIRTSLRQQFIRSEKIREYARLRSNGICELCENPAPFRDKFNRPFLETHHIIFLSQGGQDSVENVAALCPNCHRKIHNLNLDSDVTKLLQKRKLN